MTVGILVSIRNSILNLIRDAIDAAATAGKINFYTAARPATGAAITSQTLVGTVVCGDPSAPNAASGVLTLNSLTEDSNADNDGVTTWARFLDGDDTFVLDCNVGKQFTQDGNSTNGSAVISNLSNTSKMDAGMEVTGSGIPAGATIDSIDSGTQITLSANATATASGVTLTFTSPDCEILLNDNDISQGGIIRVNSCTITEGNA